MAFQLFREAFESGAPYDLAIFDLTIPGGMGGAQIMPEIQKIDHQAKVVVSIGYSTDPIISNYKQYGFCGVIPKPKPTPKNNWRNFSIRYWVNRNKG